MTKNCPTEFEDINRTYQQTMKRMSAQALDPPGVKAFPQQKQRLAAITMA